MQTQNIQPNSPNNKKTIPKDELIELIKKRIKVEEIAREYGVSKSFVYAKIRQLKMRGQYPKIEEPLISDEQLLEWREEEKLSISEIAIRSGLRENTIYQRLKKIKEDQSTFIEDPNDILIKRILHKVKQKKYSEAIHLINEALRDNINMPEMLKNKLIKMRYEIKVQSNAKKIINLQGYGLSTGEIASETGIMEVDVIKVLREHQSEKQADTTQNNVDKTKYVDER